MWIEFKNRVHLKKCLRNCLLAILLFELVFFAVQHRMYQSYTRNYNQALGLILQYVKENPNEVDINDIMEILNSKDIAANDVAGILKEYGIDFENESLILANESLWEQSIWLNITFLLVFAGALLFIFLSYNAKKDKELREITSYVEQINQRNYKLDIDTVTEDELSILKSEIYKTTVMLKEVAENAMDGKRALKNTLSDISHQLKTPLASVQIMLDNMELYPEMKAETREYYIKKMKREIQSINFLVQSLLKLSKLEADVVVFSSEHVETKSLVDAAVKNVELLSELKDIRIEVTGVSGGLCCDYRWQAEAITNVLKNCVEYSPENEIVTIDMSDNAVYTAIRIRDHGPGMSAEEQKHIFDRFYKGKNASEGSIGIGLALAKAIVEANHGKIGVESSKNGTEFEIRYFK